jgi:predicted metal-dependent phosphoesterase TrpH
MHCHTLPRSTCSALQPEELVDLAKERGLDGVCLTEHDRAWPEAEVVELGERTGFLVLAGVELTTEMGHVLAYGLPRIEHHHAYAANAFADAQRADGLLFLAHPARDGLLKVSRETVQYFESVEAVNGSDSRLQNMAATGLARGFRLPGIGGSDSHSAAEAGRAATRFEASIGSMADLLEALRSGKYEAISL